MSDEALDKLYNTFQSKKFRDDLATCIKAKGDKGMDYIPWSNVMDRFIRFCPSMTYQFHEYTLKLNEAGIQCETQRPYMGDKGAGYFVTTSITCYGVTRSMTSPVYGKTFTTVNLKPTSKDIHNAQMRCLCKNAAMFGCGIELWTREEEAQLRAEAETPADTGLDEDEIINVAKEVFNGNEVTPQQESDEACDKCGSSMVMKRGKHGHFLACPNYPDCKFTKSIQP